MREKKPVQNPEVLNQFSKNIVLGLVIAAIIAGLVLMGMLLLAGQGWNH